METAQQPKRRRVAVACDGCRRRKIKCDGQQPFCTYCIDHDLTCVYQKTPQRVQVSQEYLNSLLRQVKDRRRSSPQTSPESQQEVLPPSTSVTVDDLSSIIPSPQFGSKDENNEEFSTDAMVCAGPSPRAGGGYFGNSSTVAFLEVLQTMAFRNGTALMKGLQPSPRTDEFPVPSMLNFQTPLLPPRSTADHLVDTYFTRVSDLYTILHEPSFRVRYEQLWQPGPDEPDRLWLCILNAVFALGSLFSDRLPAEDSEATALSFFSQAKDLLNFDCLDSGSLTMVQALLLMGQYLQSTTQVNRCWYVFGLAIRTAQGLGLQLAEANQRCPPLERELRKRCWCGCLIMDTMVAMTFGRPLMIPSEHYEAVDNDDEMPAQVDDECITPTQIFSQPKNTPPPKILLFIHKARLYVVLHRILKALYQGKGEASFSGGEMLEFDRQLCAWKDKLPPCLRLDDSSQDGLDSFFLRQRHILHARYLTVRILLTRPSLAAVAATASTNQGSGYQKLRPLHDAFASTAAESCIDTATQLIEHIQHNVIADGHLLGASWYNTYSVFSAELVLFAALVSPALRRETPPTTSWQAGMDIMKALVARCSAARTCLSILDLFQKHLQGLEFEDNIDMTLSALPFQDWIGSLDWMNLDQFS